jgi:hypothetical protein
VVKKKEGFDIPKCHNQHHFAEVIELFGSTDNYNTETSECYNIDVAKRAWAATNHKNVIPQMLIWLDRQEKLFQRAAYLRWIDDNYRDDPDDLEPWGWREHDDESPVLIPDEENDEEENHQGVQYRLAVKPQFSCMNVAEVAGLYGLPDLREKLAQFLNPSRSTHQNIVLPIQWNLLDIWTSVKIHEPPVISTDDDKPEMRKILARLRTQKENVPYFQTVLIDPAPDSGQDRDVGLAGKPSFWFKFYVVLKYF